MVRRGIELEIKLTGAPRDVAALRRSPVLARWRTGKSATERLVSTYYDAADGALQKAGVSLRLRAEAGGLVQTIKRETQGEGALARYEEEQSVAPNASFPLPARDPALRRLIDDVGALAPVARTVSDRWTAELERGGARIEAAIDLGRLESLEAGAPTRTAPLAEFELELLSGRPKILFKVARALLEEGEGALRLSLLSKAAQARRLASGPAAAPAPEKAIDLAADASAADVFAAAVHAAAARLVELQPAVVDMRSPEALHQMRVALRRLRAAERLFRPDVDDSGVRALAKRARRLAATLGPARDWDVFVETGLQPLRECNAYGLPALEGRAASRRMKTWGRACAAVEASSFAVLALDLVEAAHRRRRASEDQPRSPAPLFAAAALEGRLEEARRAAAQTLWTSAAARHPLRLRLKDLRYSAQLFRAFYPGQSRRPWFAALARLQEELGALNDAALAVTLADEAAAGRGREAARAAGFVYGFYAAGVDQRAAALERDWAAFAAMTPFWREAAPELQLATLSRNAS